MTPKTCDNHRQRDKQTEFKNGVKREQISLRTKLVISFNFAKINSTEVKKSYFYQTFHFRHKKSWGLWWWVGGVSKT